MDSAILLANIDITDTTAHTYRTDPYSSKKGTGIKIVDAMHNRNPPPYTVAIPVSNGAGEELTVEVIGNVDTTKTLADYVLGTGNIAANSSDILYVYMKGPNAFPSEYVSLSLSYSTAPTSGGVKAYILFYGD